MYDTLNTDELLAFIQAEAAELGNSVYAILHRNAGWAVQWYEPSRSSTELAYVLPEKSLSPAEMLAQAYKNATERSTHLHESLHVYEFSPTMRGALLFEARRLRPCN